LADGGIHHHLTTLKLRMLLALQLNKVRLMFRQQTCAYHIHTELASHPNVLEVSVVARPHPKWGERPMAFVILNPQYADKWIGRHHEFSKNLKEYARTRLPGFACPEWVEVVPELPVSFMRILHASLMTWIDVHVIENVYRENYQD